MNSNRTKYASTPTYGMQKRNFAKRQAAAQPTPSPDFTQQPDFSQQSAVTPPVAPFPAQTPFPSMASKPVANGASFLPPVSYPNAAPYPAQAATPFGAAQGMGGAPGFMPGGNTQPYPGMQQPLGTQPFVPPQAGSVPSGNIQPLGNTVPAAGNNGFSPRVQGFVPPVYGQGSGNAPLPYPQNIGAAPAGYPQNAGAVPPSVVRSDPAGVPAGGVPQFSTPPMQPGNNSGRYQAYPGMPSGAPFNNASFVSNSGGGFPPPPSFMPGVTPAVPTPKPPFDTDKWLKIFLFGVLPVLFIPCIFVTHTFDFLRYLFVILTVVGLSVLWYRQSFTSALRTTISVVYLALCIVVIALLVGNGNRDVTQTSSALSSQNATAQVTAEPTAALAEEPTAEETVAPEEDVDGGEAEQRLSTFMDYWSKNDVESMVNLVLPSWASKQDSAAQTLFTVISNRTPQEYDIESISGTAGDSSRTVTMSAYIDKNNGKDPTRYRFMILMVNEDGEWYVDPNSLATNDTDDVTATPQPGVSTISQSLAPRMTVTPVPAADTKLYYNADGGKYYHIDPNCPAVNSKYLPMASFLYSELDNAPYSSLLPCLRCGAPTQSLGSLATEETATP